jgi:hypothetical protein
VKKKWPFPGDAPVTRARKIALAYRNQAQQQQAAMLQIREVLEALDRRLINFDNPASIEKLDTALKAVTSAGTVEELDQRFTDWGETWHAEQPDHYEPDDYVKATDAAKIVHVNPKTIATLRINGRLKGHWDPDMGNAGGYWYQVRDLHDLSSKLRGRNWRNKQSTDTLNDSGRSDTE